MATATSNVRTSQSISTEKVDVMEFNDWTLNFTYKYIGEEKPKDIAISGNKKNGGFMSVNVGQMGLDNYNLTFNPSSLFDAELVKKINDEISAIKA